MDEQQNAYLILPLKFGPHFAEFHLRTHRRHNVVHNVNVDVAQHYAIPISCTAHYIIDYKRKKTV